MADNSVNVTFPAPQPTQLTTVGDHVLATLAETGILKAGENVLRVTIGSRVWIGAIRHIPMSSDAPASSNTKSTQPTVVFGSLQTSNLAVAYAFLVECKTGKRMKLGVAEKYAWKSVFYREEGFTDVGHYTMGEPLANLKNFIAEHQHAEKKQVRACTQPSYVAARHQQRMQATHSRPRATRAQKPTSHLLELSPQERAEFYRRTTLFGYPCRISTATPQAVQKLKTAPPRRNSSFPPYLFTSSLQNNNHSSIRPLGAVGAGSSMSALAKVYSSAARKSTAFVVSVASERSLRAAATEQPRTSSPPPQWSLSEMKLLASRPRSSSLPTSILHKLAFPTQ